MPQRHTLIAKEGWSPIFSFVLLAFLLQYYFGFFVAIPTGVVVLVLLFLFRDPRRDIPATPLGIVAPMDSTVVAIEKIMDPYLEADTLRIQLRGRAWGVFTVRSPMEGKVNKQWFNAVMNDIKPSVPVSDEYFAQWVQSDEGDNVILALAPRFYKKMPLCSVHSGERIGQGQRCGFIPFGANSTVYIPANSHVEVRVGDELTGGSSIIALLVRAH
ncbi:MAG: hypothetical protein GXP08_15450 [Gammaproteobacteria bacterium]|nr:hypothetical protein [Gammaproteobacteria bacterium]